MLDGLPRRSAALLFCSLLACGADTEAPRAGEDDGDAGVEEEVPEDPAGERDAGRDARVPDARARDAEPEPREPLDAGPSEDAGRAADAGADARSDVARDAAAPDDARPPLTPAFHISLRVHRGDSGLTGSELAAILEEVNAIWWKQGAICFEVEVVTDDAPRRDGFDLWFHRSQLGCNTMANGVYCGDHDIHSLDAPRLNRADDAAWNVRNLPARTAAHELGHGLNLPHYNGYPDSNDSLMSSGRQGFKLHDAELDTARDRAADKASSSAGTPCAAVPVTD